MIDNIPIELRALKKWICRDGEMPKSPQTGRILKGPMAEWGCSFEDAVKALNKFGFDGLTLVMDENNPFCVVDIDSCVVNGEVNGIAKQIIDQIDSYTELSKSKTGIHILVENTDDNKIVFKKNDIEVYTHNHTMSITGDVFQKRKKLNKVNMQEVLKTTIKPITEDIDIVRKISDERIKKLWAGDWKNDYDTQSEADMAFVSLLAKHVNNDRVKLDRLFRASGLYRIKWDRSVGNGKTYGQMTIEKAVPAGDTIKTNGTVVVELDDLRKLPLPEVKMIMSPWLTFGSTHMVYAKRGVGKTFFSLSISLAVAHETDFADWSVEESVNVLYVDGEMLPQDMRDRAGNLMCNLGKKKKKWHILSSILNLQNGADAVNIIKKEWQDFIIKEIAEKEIKLLVLDNIASLTQGVEENDSSSWDNISVWLLKVKQTGCAVIFVHHAGKSGQQRGTSAREDALDSVIVLRPTTNNAVDGVDVDVVFEKSRHVAGAAIMPVNFKIIPVVGEQGLKWETGTSGISKKKKALSLMCEGMSYEEIKIILNIGKSTLSKYRKQAIENGWCIETSNGLEMTNQGKTQTGGNDEF